MIAKKFSLFLIGLTLLTWAAPIWAVTDASEILLPSQSSIFSNNDQRVNLPSGDALTEVIPAIVSNFFYFIGFLIFIALIYAGALLVIGRGNEENTDKAKQILTSGALALALVVMGYAVIFGISSLNFENDPQSQVDEVFPDSNLNQ